MSRQSATRSPYSTRLLRSAGALVLLAALPAGEAWAGSINGDVCMETLFGGNTVCTANDVAIARALSALPTSCEDGEEFDLAVTFEIVTTSTERYDIGLYFDTAGDPEHDGAETGACTLSTLATSPVPPNENFDADFCGDTSSANSPRTVTVAFDDVLCSDPDKDGKMNLPYCTTWNNSNDVCSTETDAKARTKSKCKCDQTFEIPVTVTPPGTLEVTKEATGTVDENGGDVTFTVKVTNTGDVDITFDTIVDDPDNDAATNNNVSYAVADVCPGSPAEITLVPDEDVTCEITRHIEGDAGESFTDNACVDAVDENENEISDCDDATVTIDDVEPGAIVTKSQVATICATVRFNVKVENDSTVDEITLDQLCDDKFGIIAGDDCPAASGTVEATTCTVPQTIPVDGDYQCTFDAEVCSAGHQNQVTASGTDDDGSGFEASGSATGGDAPPDYDE